METMTNTMSEGQRRTLISEVLRKFSVAAIRGDVPLDELGEALVLFGSSTNEFEMSDLKEIIRLLDALKAKSIS
jgi:hypothetical protein